MTKPTYPQDDQKSLRSLCKSAAVLLAFWIAIGLVTYEIVMQVIA